MKRIVFTVTNDLVYDQRMQRICSSLAANNYRVTLIGRKKKSSPPLDECSYGQRRISCFFEKGFLFYAEYNFRLFWVLLFSGADALCAIDLDTILPVYFVSLFRQLPRVYDAHEYFTEMKEIRSRRKVYRVWHAVERFALRRFPSGYTVSQGLADAFATRYGVRYEVIRNLPLRRSPQKHAQQKSFLLYQGAVNEARGFEWLVPAMQSITMPLVICGDGNFMENLKSLIAQYKVQDKVELKGMLRPAELVKYTDAAYIGINFTEKDGLNQYYALPNKFFDYIQAGIPQVTNNYPEYARINSLHEVALLIDDMNAGSIHNAVQRLIDDRVLYERLQHNTNEAALVYHWEAEQEILLRFYKNLFHGR